jgi:hypothetical protein
MKLEVFQGRLAHERTRTFSCKPHADTLTGAAVEYRTLGPPRSNFLQQDERCSPIAVLKLRKIVLRLKINLY